MIDYAQMVQMQAWLRHPMLGDPSFDTFERIGDCVHTSEKPFEWAVNGSLFRDPKDGAWYYYAGLYPYGYAIDEAATCHFIIYKSVDEGANWTNLGPVFEEGFKFDGFDVACDISPDAVLTYDQETDTYWLAYDWCSNNTDWKGVFQPVGTGTDSGGALAWSKSPAGPFTRLTKPHISNVEQWGQIGRFKRMYANTLLKRKDDWIALVLCDSNDYFSWGLACMTAASPEGPWSKPVIVLSVDRPEYYPALVEFYPSFVEGDTVYAPATSVGASRNYQAVFAAKLEEAEQPEAWSLLMDGNAWHSRPSLDEKYGIWGQTFHGFVHDGQLNVMYPSKNELDHGTLFAASRPWNQPHSDGFTLSGHVGKAISPIMASYADFSLDAVFRLTGSMDLVFDYSGILGPDKAASDARLHARTVANYSALRLNDDLSYKLLTIDRDGTEHVHASGVFRAADGQEEEISVKLRRSGNTVTAMVGGVELPSVELAYAEARPLALIAHEFSNVSCSSFEVTGEMQRYELFYNGNDAMLGAGQRLADWKQVQSDLYRSGQGLIGDGQVKAKWNVIGDSFDIYAPKLPELGSCEVYVDGEYSGSLDLYSAEPAASAVVYTVEGLAHGRHSILLKPGVGAIAIDLLAVRGAAEALV